MITLHLTDTQTAIVMQALSHYMYNNPHVSEEQWEIANSVLELIDEEI
jgi:hypothetical protein